jgi:antitoxin VapB
MLTKHERITALLDEHALDGLLIRQVSNFAWATDGAASYINTATTYGSATLLVTRDQRHLITNNIEAPRYRQEEKLEAAGWVFHFGPWYRETDILPQLTRGMKLGADHPYPNAVDLSAALSLARAQLDMREQNQFRNLSTLCAQAMDEAIRAVRPGMSEHALAGLLAAAALGRGVQPIVNLVATDQRIFQYRHPLPTSKIMARYAMLVLCGRQHGLVCSITRLIHFGPLPAELQAKSEAVAAIDAAMIASTRPGVSLAQVFAAAQVAYARIGYPDEYKLHHQGGLAGYEPRERIANPGTAFLVAAGQAYAWNPSISGCKSEDTILVLEDGFEILTEIDGWPLIPVEVDGVNIPRPAILTIDD